LADKRQPWMKWYPRDWRGDGALRMCSFAARGLWADLISLMHDEGEPYGFLLINGRPPTPAQLARILGGSTREIEALLAELAAAGVYDTGVDGVIVCRRMVRDKAKADADRTNGKRGGNRILIERDNGGVNPQHNPPDKAQKPEARSQKPEEGLGIKIPIPDLRASRASSLNGDTREGRRELWRGKVTRYVTAHAPPAELEEFAREVGANTAKGRELLNRWDRVMRGVV